MSEDEKPSEISLNYLREWERQFGELYKIAPEVRKAREFAEWQNRGADTVKRYGPAEITIHMNQKLVTEAAALKNALPLPGSFGISYMPSITALSTATSTAAANLSVFSAVSTLDTTASEVCTLLNEYTKLQESQGRVSGAKAGIQRVFPHLLQLFQTAEDAVHRASIVLDTTTAPLEMRNFLEKFKGELMDKARLSPSEKPDWATMTDRLVDKKFPDRIRQFIEQEDERNNLHYDLSGPLKRRNSIDIKSYWSRVVDHTYIVCNCIS